MSTIELLLRLGCSLVGWMVIYTYCLWLATLRVIGCGPDEDEFWRLLLAFAPLAAGFALLIGLSARLPGIHQILRWGFVPLVLLIPLALPPVWSTFSLVNIDGYGICTPRLAGAWQLWWAPIQLMALVVISIAAYRLWRAPAPE